MYTLILSAKFQKQLAVIVKGNFKLKKQIAKTIKLVHLDINHPSLRLHKLSGQNNWSVSVTRNVRIILHWEKDKIYFLRTGKHEDIY